MIRGIHHTAISTKSLDRSLRFYRDLLGFELVFSFEWPKGTEPADRITGLENSSAKGVMLKAGNMLIELFQYQSPMPKEGNPARPVCDHGFTHICIDVIDIDSEYERLKRAGMVFHCPPQDFGFVKATYGRDPDGNVVEIQEVMDAHAPIALTYSLRDPSS